MTVTDHRTAPDIATDATGARADLRAASLPPLPPRPAPDPNYRTRGACNGDPNPDRWLDLPPIRIRGKDNPDYDTAVAALADVCATCPVADACLWDALAYDVLGVFAGTDEFIRADLRTAHDLPAPIRLDFDSAPDDIRMREQRFTARRLARTGLSNIAIAEHMGVSAMSITRFLDERA